MDETQKPEENIEQLRKLNAAKTDLISISAHQLRTSIAALRWILKMFLDGDLGALTDEQKNFLTKAMESSNRMNRLVNDLLTLNHTEDITLTYEFKKQNLKDIVESVLFEFSGEAHEKDIQTVFLKPEGDAPLVNVDEEKFRVVLQNLIENAIKYSDQDDKVFISVSANQDSVKLSVKDNGIGIPKDEQEHVFDKFFRAENAKKKESIGSGLGLYTTKQIVEKHNGTISFESSDHGTTFTVTLPKVT